VRAMRYYERSTAEKLSVVYRPKGRPGEYADWAVNLYWGCGHECSYCYAPDVVKRDRIEFHANPTPRKGILEKFEADCAQLEGKLAQPIQMCFTCDPYQPIEAQERITRRAIEIAHGHGLRVEILTKAGKLAQRDFELLLPGDAFAQTLTFDTITDSTWWEPRAGLPHERVANLQEAHRRGIRTWVSLEPVIEPGCALNLIRQTHEYVDEYRVGVWNYDARAREIDYKEFGARVLELFRTLNAKYYLKDDLRRAMGLKQRVVKKPPGEYDCRKHPLDMQKPTSRRGGRRS